MPKPTKYLTDTEVAKHWKVAQPYLSKARKTKGMPRFRTLAEADAWREANQQRPARSPNSHAAQPPAHFLEQMSKIGEAPKPSKLSFEEEMVENARSVAQMAFEAYKIVLQAGQGAAVGMAIKNWNDAAKAAAEARQRYLDLLEKSGTLISVDRALSVFGDKLQPLRVRLLKMGERIGTKANPGDPNAAKVAIDEEIDEIFKQIEIDRARAENELKEVAE